jgi:hypothetical protein
MRRFVDLFADRRNGPASWTLPLYFTIFDGFEERFPGRSCAELQIWAAVGHRLRVSYEHMHARMSDLYAVRLVKASGTLIPSETLLGVRLYPEFFLLKLSHAGQRT